jgi:pyruvate kinase
MKISKTQIVATIGPSSGTVDILEQMIRAGMDVARLNFSWGTHEKHAEYIQNIRTAAQNLGRTVPIILDLSGPRIQDADGHRFNDAQSADQSIITEKDRGDIEFGVAQHVEYIALSYVGSAADIRDLQTQLEHLGSRIPVIAKIERAEAVEKIDEIIDAADAVMIARGDLGNAIPFGKLLFVQKEILRKTKAAQKPVITATQMLYSMTKSKTPTRAEIMDVSGAVFDGSDAVMLSEESANGSYPIEAVTTMESIILDVEQYRSEHEFYGL